MPVTAEMFSMFLRLVKSLLARGASELKRQIARSRDLRRRFPRDGLFFGRRLNSFRGRFFLPDDLSFENVAGDVRGLAEGVHHLVLVGIDDELVCHVT